MLEESSDIAIVGHLVRSEHVPQLVLSMRIRVYQRGGAQGIVRVGCSAEEVSSVEVRTGGGLTTETSAYFYDDLGRLSQVTLPDGTIRLYTFDLDSNRTSLVENGLTVATYTYDPNKLDQLATVTQGGTTAYSYNVDGHVSGRGSDALTWDGRDRHSGGTFGGTSVSYGFDAAGFRRMRTGAGTTTHYRLSGLYETNTSGTILSTDSAGPAGDLAHDAGPPTWDQR